MIINFYLNTMVHAYIYCRVSSKEQSNQLNGHVSLEVQEKNCREYAERKGYHIKEIITEVGSGRNLKKLKNLQKLIKEIKRNKHLGEAFLLVNNISRFARNSLQALILMEDLRSYNCGIFSVQEHLNMKNAIGRHTFRTTLSIAEYESDQISERVKAAFALKRTLGSKLGMAPYGFHARTEDGIRKFVKNDYEQDVISFIQKIHSCNYTDRELTKYMRKISEDNNPIEFYENDFQVDKINSISYKEIANLLNEFHVTKRDLQWTPGMVSGIIKANKLKKVQKPAPGIAKRKPIPTRAESKQSNKRQRTVNSLSSVLDSMKM